MYLYNLKKIKSSSKSDIKLNRLENILLQVLPGFFVAMDNKLVNIDVDKCILVEFTNEFDKDDQKLLQIGYACWLSEDDEHSIDEIIKNQKVVVVKWPNCQIIGNCSRAFKSKLKCATFQDHAITVISHGSKYLFALKIRKSPHFDV